MKALRPGVIAALLTLAAWGALDWNLTYSWEYSCSTDTECELEDDVRAKAEGKN